MQACFSESGNSIDVYLLQSVKAVLRHSTLLEVFADRCGQSGAMHWLSYFLTHRSRLRFPYLVLIVRKGANIDTLTADDLIGAGLYLEYRLWGIRSKIFSTEDCTAIRTIVAPPELRAAVAAIGARTLMQHGAHVVLTTFESAAAAGEPGIADWLAGSGCLYGERTRKMRRDFILGKDYETTLASFGKRTRTHLRYYRRKLESRIPLEYVADALPELTPEAIDRLNSRSLNPKDAIGWRRRFEAAAQTPGSFISGLRAKNGEWLSLIGGWRRSTTTVLYWQMNAGGYEKDSIVTVMRSFFFEHEVNRGTRRVVFFGGTHHSMSHAFQEQTLKDIVLKRKSLRGFAVGPLAWLANSLELIKKNDNFLVESLSSQDMQWYPLPEKAATVSIPLREKIASGRSPLRKNDSASATASPDHLGTEVN